MLGRIVRFVMFIASIITGWFVARDTASFDVIEMVVSLLLIIVFLAVGAFWPYLVACLPTGARRAGPVLRPAPGISVLDPLGCASPAAIRDKQPINNGAMNDGYLTAMAAMAGSAIGALASLGTTWLTNKRSLCPVGAMNS